MIDRRETKLIRPWWEYDDLHKQMWKDEDITVIICERDTLDITRLTLESLLRFYPDIPILFVDGGSEDGSLEYLKYMGRKHSNIEVWHRGGRNGHGTMLDDGIRQFITTKYILLMDSDVIVRRGGWIEDMLEQMESRDIYAIGTIMLVTNSNDGCGEPKDDNDILRYAHPSCSMIRRSTYLTLPPFIEHGAPLVHNMQEAQKLGLKVEYYPIEYYCAHMSGASYNDPRTIWRTDMGVHMRPLVTFIIPRDVGLYLGDQIDKDFDIVYAGPIHKEKVVIHDVGHFNVGNDVFQLRHRVTGDYVCKLETDCALPEDFIKNVRLDLTKTYCPDVLNVDGGIKIVKREIWQQTDSLS